MSIIQGSAKRASVRGFYPKEIEGSLRFNDDDSAYLSWTPDSAGNRKTFTISVWVKRGTISASSFYPYIFDGGTSYEHKLSFVNDYIAFGAWAGSQEFNLETNAVYRDPSAWYHIVVAQDTTQATASDRVKMYVNGEQVTSFRTSSYPSLNYEGRINNTNEHAIGRWQGGTSRYFDGYMAEFNFVDGTAYTADDFGELKNGVWVAKTPDVTYGTNGFHLNFQDDTEVEAFNTVLYRGNGGDSNSVTGFGFEPDLIWLKERSSASAYSHRLLDQVRGTNSVLYSNATSAEGTGTSTLLSFDSDGFTVGSDVGANATGGDFVAWGWKAGDSNVSNTDGSITSTVRANQTYGFSVVSYTGNGSGGTIGHGLGVAPDMIITKDRDSGTQEWVVYHSSLSAGYDLFLHTTSSQQNRPQDYTTTAPTSSVYSVGSGNPTAGISGDDYIAYCWAEKTGYSKFGSYTGGTSNYAITTGFRPSLVIIKSTTAVESWSIFDGTRNTSNPVDNVLSANTSGAEYETSHSVDFNDTGFDLNSTHPIINGSGNTYIYAAFADTREAAFWLDQSGNDNDWQPVNLDHNDTVADSPTDNFATLNPLDKGANITISNGNLTANYGNAHQAIRATHAVSSGQFYWEVNSIWSSNQPHVGIMGTDAPITEQAGSDRFYGYRANGDKIVAGVSTAGAGATWDQEGTDTIGVALDMDAGEVTFYKNNTLQFTITGLSGEFAPVLKAYASDVYQTINFGQQPFKYDPPA